ncbi:lanthionine synthetase C family protein [Acrocarpospora sp. B8E8]|uniref:lanthionine synthetase C family protein n=1 Tax=Acrocarpospora sp. B8E8 TaxID=3153572 RepID=UPI00325E8B11
MNAMPGDQSLAVAERLLQPEAVVAAVPSLEAASLAHGLAGTALLHARLATVAPIFGAAADRHWAVAASHARRLRAVGAGVFTTGGGLAASLIIGTKYLSDPSAMQAPAARAAAWLSRQAQRVTDDLAQRRRDGDPHIRRAGYDTINGLAGIGRVLLAAVDQPAAESGLIRALETLIKMIMTGYGTRPGWWLPASLHPPRVKVDQSGSAATGMAHGIAGPLAFLSLACTRGWAIPGQYDAIRQVSQWLLDWKADGAWQWPTSISGSELDAGSAHPTGRQDAWCYGTPGISAALGLAAQALGESALAEASDAAMNSLAARAAHTWDADGPTLCHGHAGILQCATNRQPKVASKAAAVINAAFDPSRPFAIPHTDNGAIEDHPGFLTGAAGTALALAQHGRLPAPVVPDPWDCVLLLS